MWRISHQESGCKAVYWCVSSTAAEEQRVIMSAKMGPRGDRTGTTSAEMSQMSQVHSHRQWERGNCWGGGLAVRLCRVGSVDNEMDVLLCFRGPSVGGLQSRGYLFIV